MLDQTTIKTPRLVLHPLSDQDAAFIKELVNTEGWLRFIGDRNITSLADASAYIQRIINDEHCVYWVVRLQTDQTKIGLVTFIKRHYLPHPDIGFAFLPDFGNTGYAYEAAQAVLQMLINTQSFEQILATTLPVNALSVKLLRKLGLAFVEEIDINNQKLAVFGMPVHKSATQ